MSIQVNELLREFKPLQRRWVIARVMTDSDAGAARRVGVAPATVCRWSNKAELDEVVNTLKMEPLAQAMAILQGSLPEAAQGLVDLSIDRNKNIRIRALEGVLDRGLGKPTQSIEQVGDAADAVADLSRRMAATLPDVKEEK